MKRSPDYYTNRRRLKQLQYDNVKFRPTVEDIKEWFPILNEQIFGNKLKDFTEIRVKKLRRTHAFFNYEDDRSNRDTSIDMHCLFSSKKLFVEILAHEMVHHFQHSYNEPLGHGPSFLAWRDNFKLRGLTLYKVA